MHKPIISIILPSLRPFQLAQCLASIHKYTHNIDYEVIVISPFTIKSHPNIVHVREDKPEGVYKAVAKGYELVKGEYIIHIPDDSRATPHWANNMIAFMRPHDNELFEGNFRLFDARGERSEPGYYGKLFAPFLCIRKDVTDKIGGLMDCYYFSFFGDPDLSLRVWYNGGSVETCPNAWMYHADCEDEIHKTSNNMYFFLDREAFIQRWHDRYARPEDSKDIYTSMPISAEKMSKELPPEKCVQIYLNMQKRAWRNVTTLLKSDDTNFCIYPESMPILHALTLTMIQSGTAPKRNLFSVLIWLQENGYVTSQHTGDFKENSHPHQIFRGDFIRQIKRHLWK